MTEPALLYKRAFRLTVDTIQIDSTKTPVPLQVRFSVKKNLKPEPNKCDIQIWNLNQKHRSQLEQLASVPVQLEAGYIGSLHRIFIGDLRTAITIRDSQVDLITSIGSGDGEKALRSARVNISVKKATSVDYVLKLIGLSLGVAPGNLDDAAKQLSFASIGSMFSQGTVLSGNAAREMSGICKSVGLTWSVQEGKLQLLPIGKALAKEAIKCSADTGMLGSPTVDSKGILTVKMLLVPDVYPGRLLVVRSEHVNGNYRIEETTHAGDFEGKDWCIDIKAARY